MSGQQLHGWTMGLAREELALLIELAGASTIPTLGSQPYGTGDPERIDLLRQAAAKSLAERELIVVEQGAITGIDGLLKGAILFCVYPQSMVSMMSRYAADSGPQCEAYYQVPDVTVYHRAAHDERHALTLMAPPIDLCAMIYERLNPYATEQTVTINLPYQDFEHAPVRNAGNRRRPTLALPPTPATARQPTHWRRRWRTRRSVVLSSTSPRRSATRRRL